MAADSKPYFIQFYGEGTCGHQKVNADDDHCGACKGEYHQMEEWLQCPICNTWFHSDCFYE